MHRRNAVPGENLAGFYRLQGRRVVQAAGAYWVSFNLTSRCYMSIPDMIELDPDPAEIEDMLYSVNGLAARYASREQPGIPSGFYFLENKDYCLESLDRKTRHAVRRGLQNFEIRPVEQDELLKQGLKLNRDTMKRQGRFNPEFGVRRHWEWLVKAAYEIPAISVTGCFSEGKLAVYAIDCREDGWSYGLFQNSGRQYLKQNPNHALDFYLAERAARDPLLRGVTNGPVSISDNPGLHAFKTSLGYKVEPHNAVIRLHPAASAVLCTAPVIGALSAARRFAPRNGPLNRILGIARDTRESKRAADLRIAPGRPKLAPLIKPAEGLGDGH